MNPRDEVFLHEFMHGLDGYYGKKAGVTLPKGALHGRKQRTDYVVKTYRPGDTFRGTMEWYRDYLQGVIQEDGKMVGFGPVAWKHGPMREAAKKLQASYKPTDLPVGTYPEWVYELMKGDVTHAELGPPLLEEDLPSGDISKSAWQLDLWNKNAAFQAKTESADGGTFVLRSPAPNSAAISRTIPLEASTNYVFTAEVRTVGVEITEKGGSHSVTLSAGDSISTLDLSGTNSWTKIALPFTTSPKPESCVLKISIGGFASLAKGEARFRNVQVKKIRYPATGSKTK